MKLLENGGRKKKVWNFTVNLKVHNVESIKNLAKPNGYMGTLEDCFRQPVLKTIILFNNSPSAFMYVLVFRLFYFST